jgi:8-oxo-dGTP pyrophosphatase MutT (NUDIX family)
MAKRKPSFHNKPVEVVETKDGREVWLARKVGVVAENLCVHEDGVHVLVEKRGPNVRGAGKWCLPCGYFDMDECGGEAATREVWEETGLNLEEVHYGRDDEEIIHWGMKQPWAIDTEPYYDKLQTICLHYGVFFQAKELPALSTENAEEGEVDEACWKQLGELLPTPKRDALSFRHGDFLERFVRAIKSLTPWVVWPSYWD